MSVHKPHTYHTATAARFARIDRGIIEALQDERYLNIKQLRRKLHERKIYESGQCIRRRCEAMEKNGQIQRLNYNAGRNGRQCWRLIQ